MDSKALPGFEDAISFSLIEALRGQQARRFSTSASIPDGPLTFTKTKIL
jgi:hypothetical protein